MTVRQGVSPRRIEGEYGVHRTAGILHPSGDSWKTFAGPPDRRRRAGDDGTPPASHGVASDRASEPIRSPPDALPSPSEMGSRACWSRPSHSPRLGYRGNDRGRAHRPEAASSEPTVSFRLMWRRVGPVELATSALQDEGRWAEAGRVLNMGRRRPAGRYACGRDEDTARQAASLPTSANRPLALDIPT